MPLSSSLKSPSPPFQECIRPQVGCYVKNEVDVVLALSLTSSLWSLLPSLSPSKSPPSLPGMHPTTGWLLCQKMRLSMSSPLVSLSLSSCHRRHNHPLSLWSLFGRSSSSLKSPPFPARNASDHWLVVVSKNEVIVVLAIGVFVVVLVHCHRR